MWPGKSDALYSDAYVWVTQICVIFWSSQLYLIVPLSFHCTIQYKSKSAQKMQRSSVKKP